MANAGAEDYGPTVKELGREYGVGIGAKYLLPIDALERERLDVMHAMLKTARHKDAQLLHAPDDMLKRKDNHSHGGAKVLDLACGTGVWLLEMSEKYPHVDFHGCDINKLAPTHLRDNITIHCPVDIEEPWTSIPNDWDLIHLQLGLGAFKDWGTIYRRIFQHLRPGTGWFEGVEIDWQPRIEGQPLDIEKPLGKWWHDFHLSNQWLGFPINYSESTGEALQLVGFRDISFKEYQIPMSGWHPKNKLHKAGVWCNIAMASGQDKNHGLEAMSLRTFSRVHKWDEKGTSYFCQDAMREASSSDIHAYFRLFVWWARAPAQNEMGPEEWQRLHRRPSG